MTDSEPPEQSIDDLIGPSGSPQNPLDQVRQNLTAEEWKALRIDSLDLPVDSGPVLLFYTPSAEEAAELHEWLSDRVTILPLHQMRKPVASPMHEFCAMIVSESFLPLDQELEQFAEGIPVALLRDGGDPGFEGNLWQLPRPITQLKNADVIESLLQGEHPPTISEHRREKFVSPVPEPPPLATAPIDARPDTISAIRALLEARKNGDSTSEALRRWVVEDPAFLGWVELKNAADGIEVKVGGKDPGSVLRSVGDEIDTGEPIPTTVGSLGPFFGFPISESWLGFLARNTTEGRKEFWNTFSLVPLIEQLIPRVAGDGTPLVEDPQDRFCRLLATRLNSAKRRGGVPGVLLLESPEGCQELVSTARELLRGSDWMEVAGQRLWILLDQPEQGAVESLTRRFSEALPGLRGGGTIRVPTDVSAEQCMERVMELLQSSDRLRIEE
ncbi:MAG: hypothetical protein VX764_03220 [Planctomycetota bacterium]|nr:hypothetical protein [Planctomycetota bacterium]